MKITATTQMTTTTKKIKEEVNTHFVMLVAAVYVKENGR